MIASQPDLFDIGERLSEPTEAEPRPPLDRCTPALSGTGPENQTCRSCKNKTATFSGSGKRFLKCEVMRRHWTHGGATDIKARWDACSHWRPATGETQTEFYENAIVKRQV